MEYGLFKSHILFILIEPISVLTLISAYVNYKNYHKKKFYDLSHYQLEFGNI